MSENEEGNGSKMFYIFMKTLLNEFTNFEIEENPQTQETIENCYNSKNFVPLISLWDNLANEANILGTPPAILFRSFLREFQESDPEWLFWFFDGFFENRAKDYAKQILPFFYYSLVHEEFEFNWDKEFDAEEFIQWCQENEYISDISEIGNGAYFLWRCFPRFNTESLFQVQKLSENAEE
uniref:Uncharacterized protein n=1 Tax=Panagrolaimus sp. PS1159 TaxID=55785 RepID=A0AC35F2Z0_9BILA